MHTNVCIVHEEAKYDRSVGEVVKHIAVGTGGLGFDFQSRQTISGSVVNGSPPLPCFCVIQAPCCGGRPRPTRYAFLRHIANIIKVRFFFVNQMQRCQTVDPEKGVNIVIAILVLLEKLLANFVQMFCPSCYCASPIIIQFILKINALVLPCNQVSLNDGTKVHQKAELYTEINMLLVDC